MILKASHVRGSKYHSFSGDFQCSLVDKRWDSTFIFFTFCKLLYEMYYWWWEMTDIECSESETKSTNSCLLCLMEWVSNTVFCADTVDLLGFIYSGYLSLILCKSNQGELYCSLLMETKNLSSQNEGDSRRDHLFRCIYIFNVITGTMSLQIQMWPRPCGTPTVFR